MTYFKAIGKEDLSRALNRWKWSKVYPRNDVEENHQYVVDKITGAQDVVAPLKAIKVRKGRDLYLAEDTLKMMAARDNAKPETYRQLRKRVPALRPRTNLTKLDEAKGDPKALWGLANEALGKPVATLPSSLIINGIETKEVLETATAMNTFNIEKVNTNSRLALEGSHARTRQHRRRRSLVLK